MRHDKSHTGKLMLQNRIDRLQYGGKKDVICLVRQEKTGSRHGREELQQLGARAWRKMFDMRGNVVDDSQESRVDGVQLSFAGSDQSVDGLDQR